MSKQPFGVLIAEDSATDLGSTVSRTVIDPYLKGGRNAAETTTGDWSPRERGVLLKS